MKIKGKLNFMLFLFLFLSLAGCSAVNRVGNILFPEIDSGKLIVTIFTMDKVNLNKWGQSQPIKVCIILTKTEEVIFEKKYDKLPCSNIDRSDNKIIEFKQGIMLPDSRKSFEISVNFDEKNWLIVAAEYQDVEHIKMITVEEIPRQKKNNLIFVVGKNFIK